ncbi:MAG: hypothetical protein M1812_003670 [Candelaria pacifica]|nr:MAG: hypothetical protein M1812_003670 [Candelaria pacifica]
MEAPPELKNTFPTPPAPVSSKTYTIAGILTTVYGLDELQPSIQEVACLWLLHSRLATKSSMDPIAAAIIGDWNRRLQDGKAGQTPKGLIAASFDQRNHGSREVDSARNGSWRDGNPTHAVDMFSIYHGTAMDTSLLLTYLSSYVFPQNENMISTNLVLGVSLGGHAAWHCLLHEPGISAVVVVIGSPDFSFLMMDRAAKSKLKTWKHGPSSFFNSPDFPTGLVHAKAKWDPAGLLTEQCNIYMDRHIPPDKHEIQRLKPLMKRYFAGKRVLNLAGGADKLVPYKRTEPFITWLKTVTNKGGLFAEVDCVVEDIVFSDVGHEMSPGMMKEAIRFISEKLTGNVTDGDEGSLPPLGKDSKKQHKM